MIVLIVLGCLAALFGLVFCVIPGIPGPPFSFLALILLQTAKKGDAFSPSFLLVMGIITILVTAVDYVFPALGAKKFGATRKGFWGAVIGMLLGMVLFPPLGIFIGAFVGAIGGELMGGKLTSDALRAGWGVFLGIMLGFLVKILASGVMAFYFIKGLF